jgi:tight adherence protein B
MALLIAALIFAFFAVLIVGVWWISESRRRLSVRLAGMGATGHGVVAGDLLLAPAEGAEGALGQVLARVGLGGRLASLAEQAGYKPAASDLALVVLAFALVGGGAVWLRTGGLFWAVIAAPIAGALPIVYLLYKRNRRINTFQTQFPEALDMVSRAIRAGNALTGAIRIVGEEMPDPTAAEFRKVSEEIRLGMDPGDALTRLESRAPTDDVRFFCTAVRIQRGAGGNLAEVLDRLAEVIRERFKLLSYARVLSAQHRWSAICVGLSPIVFGLMFEILRPGYFAPLLTDPRGPWLIAGGLVLEVIGFFMIWRIAQIRV